VTGEDWRYTSIEHVCYSTLCYVAENIKKPSLIKERKTTGNTYWNVLLNRYYTGRIVPEVNKLKKNAELCIYSKWGNGIAYFKFNENNSLYWWWHYWDNVYKKIMNRLNLILHTLEVLTKWLLKYWSYCKLKLILEIFCYGSSLIKMRLWFP
jgi:hypothetical protein